MPDDVLEQTASMYTLVNSNEEAGEAAAWVEELVRKENNAFEQGVFSTSIVPHLACLLRGCNMPGIGLAQEAPC